MAPASLEALSCNAAAGKCSAAPEQWSCTVHGASERACGASRACAARSGHPLRKHSAILQLGGSCPGSGTRTAENTQDVYVHHIDAPQGLSKHPASGDETMSNIFQAGLFQSTPSLRDGLSRTGFTGPVTSLTRNAEHQAGEHQAAQGHRPRHHPPCSCRTPLTLPLSAHSPPVKSVCANGTVLGLSIAAVCPPHSGLPGGKTWAMHLRGDVCHLCQTVSDEFSGSVDRSSRGKGKWKGTRMGRGKAVANHMSTFPHACSCPHRQFNAPI